MTATEERTFYFRPALARVCCGDPVVYLRAMFARVARELAPREKGVVLLDLRYGQVSPAGAGTLAKSVGLVVGRKKMTGSALRMEVTR